MKYNVNTYEGPSFSLKNRLLRVWWNIIYILLFRYSPNFMYGWRSIILRVFGAEIGKGVHVYPQCKIWAPWNLVMDDYSCLGPFVDCYNQGKIQIGKKVVVSQKSYLCASTHNYNLSGFPLVCKPIAIDSEAWIAADAFVGPGVTIGDGAVIAARAVVVKDVEPWTIVGGNPAVFIKKRVIKDTEK